MLTENDVIGTVCLHLAQNRHRIVSKCATKDRGIDIVAEHPEFGRILIEAKGETTAHKTSKRDGRAFDSAQVRNHVANAIYTALRLHGTGDRVAIAFPDSALHRKRLEEVNSRPDGARNPDLPRGG